MALSSQLLRRYADAAPRRIPKAAMKTPANRASSMVAGINCLMSSATGRRVISELPKSPCRVRVIQWMYWMWYGSSSIISARIRSTTSWGTRGPRAARTGSPGATRTRTKISSDSPRRTTTDWISRCRMKDRIPIVVPPPCVRPGQAGARGAGGGGGLPLPAPPDLAGSSVAAAGDPLREHLDEPGVLHVAQHRNGRLQLRPLHVARLVRVPVHVVVERCRREQLHDAGLHLGVLGHALDEVDGGQSVLDHGVEFSVLEP